MSFATTGRGSFYAAHWVFKNHQFHHDLHYTTITMTNAFESSDCHVAYCKQMLNNKEL